MADERRSAKRNAALSRSGEAEAQTATADERRSAKRKAALSRSGEATARTTTADERRSAKRKAALNSERTLPGRYAGRAAYAWQS
jgi:hypothetical protein